MPNGYQALALLGTFGSPPDVMARFEGTLLWFKLLRLLQMTVSSVLLISCVQLRRWPQSGCVNGGFKMSYRAEIDKSSHVRSEFFWAAVPCTPELCVEATAVGRSKHSREKSACWLLMRTLTQHSGTQGVTGGPRGESKRQGTHDKTLKLPFHLPSMYHVPCAGHCCVHWGPSRGYRLLRPLRVCVLGQPL